MRDIQDFASLKIKLASPEDIRAWSYGEVKKPETINYRTLRPERDGLFCEKIFGTTKEWECYCGKFKSIRYKGVICDRCGVEVTHFKVRRERTGHIELAAPVSHIWYYHSTPSRMGLLLDLKVADLRSILYYEKYIVIDPGETNLKKMELLDEDQYEEAQELYGGAFTAGMGAEAIKTLLENLDLEEIRKSLREKMQEKGAKSDAHLLKRIEIVENFISSGNKASWMVLDVVPVIPPDLRPMVQLDGGRFATSDLNDLYRRVINRNNRLKRLMELSAPDIIIRNEKRMLQEAVDSLFDNSKRKQRTVKGSSNRPLKSISDMIKGKQGRFRQNLLGKRVDYSGRSVIVVGPELKLWQSGLPEKMALELFKPFIIKRIVDKGVATNIKRAKNLVESEAPEVYAILDEVVREHPVMLNRAPTLHRLGIQAFEPVLVPGKALKLHPLACKAFNADFDGDQMAIHVPLTQAAQMECWTLMLSARNLLDPANGNSIVNPSQDMVLGIYYMTSIKPGAKGEGHVFSSADEVRLAASSGAINWQAKIKIHRNILNKCVADDSDPDGKWIETTAGRMAFNESMPDEVDFQNDQLGDKKLKKMIESVYHVAQTSDKMLREYIESAYGVSKMDPETLEKLVADSAFNSKVQHIFNRETPLEEEKLRKLLNGLYLSDRPWLTVQMLDSIKACGYKNATFYGATLSMDDILVPEEKAELVRKTEEEVKKYINDNRVGNITDKERYEKSTNAWGKTTDALTNLMYEKLQKDKDGFNTIYMMATSGARGSKKQISQLAAMRGLMQKPNGDIIELPIKSNFKEGLSVIEYFISSNGARKGLSDTALKTADAGYMTRKLVDVAQDVVVNEEDCGTINGIDYAAIKEGDEVKVSLASRIEGHFTIERVIDPVDGTLLADVNQYIDDALAKKIDEAGVEKVKIRTVLTCESKHGVCVKCYGKDLARNKIVEIGEAVGTIAGQSIGQPGTQLTLRTFHTGGAAETTSGDNKIVMKYPVYVLSVEGTHVVQDNGWLFTRRGKMVVSKLFNRYAVESGDEVIVVNGGRVRKGNLLLKHKGEEITASDNGRIIIKDNVIYLVSNEIEESLENGTFIYKDFVNGGCVVEKDVPVGEFDQYNEPIIAEVSGTIYYEDIIPGSTLDEKTNKQTGKVTRTIIETHLESKQPRVSIKDEDGNELGSYHLPTGSILNKADRDSIVAGERIAALPKAGSKANDITLGLPRVNELFQASRPKDPAVIAKITGVVSFGQIVRAKRTVIVTDENGTSFEHQVPINKRLIVRDGDNVKAGEKLCEGSVDAHDELNVLGEDALQNFLLDEIQGVYRAQEVNINDKHIGIIIRQMLKKVEIIKVGDTKFRFGQEVDKHTFREENAKTIAAGGQPAVARPKLQGITKAALTTDSFISACSFQETTKVLTDAAIEGKQDYLHGLKENVIIGHIIPAGSGMKQYHNIKLSDSSNVDLDVKMAELLELRRQQEDEARQEEMPSFATDDIGDED
ncbi:MAG: DNA-directed RNA polymerase subunit beta' [Spirochaetia bacterium]|nr:DNA-directed RNA polymerase subunit beta' [Spirochaetia bacterium]